MKLLEIDYSSYRKLQVLKILVESVYGKEIRLILHGNRRQNEYFYGLKVSFKFIP